MLTLTLLKEQRESTIRWEFPISELPFPNFRFGFGKGFEFTKEFTKIADKNMRRYAKICHKRCNPMKGKKAGKA